MLDLLNMVRRKRADHPMYDVDEARRLLADLPADQARSFDEISSWLETVTLADGYAVGDRIGVVMLLDETGQLYESLLLESFLRQAGLKEHDRLKLWQALVGFWERVSAAYRRCLRDIAQQAGSAALHPEFTLVVTRALRALASETKMLHLRYVPVTPRIWQELAELYGLSEKTQHAEDTLKAYATDAVLTGPRREFLRVMMLEAAAPESEQSAAVELSARIIARFASAFIFGARPGPGLTFCFDLARPDHPVPASPKASASPTLRYFGAGQARASLQEVIAGYIARPEETDRRFGEEYSIGDKLMVMKHLLLYWGDAPPHRRGPRVKLDAKVKISRGFEAVAELATRIEFSGMAQMTEDQRLKVKQQTGITFQAQEATAVITEWMERDGSAWGIGVDIPRQDEPWAKIGTLCALQAPGQKAWWVGAIQRLHRDTDDRPHAGIEIFAKKPLSVYLRGIGEGTQRADNWQTSSGSFQFTYLNAILLGENAAAATRHEILLKRDGFNAGIIYEVMMGETFPHLRLEELLERGEDFDRVRVTWLKGITQKTAAA
jgi:hypothetical protein